MSGSQRCCRTSGGREGRSRGGLEEEEEEEEEESLKKRRGRDKLKCILASLQDIIYNNNKNLKLVLI